MAFLFRFHHEKKLLSIGKATLLYRVVNHHLDPSIRYLLYSLSFQLDLSQIPSASSIYMKKRLSFMFQFLNSDVAVTTMIVV